MLDGFVLQGGQVLTVIWLSPLLRDFIVTMEERGQGPSIFQPYQDLWKLFHKTLLIPESASWVFFWAPVVAFLYRHAHRADADPGADHLL